jgi:sec-independent protein translocase protein TatB
MKQREKIIKSKLYNIGVKIMFGLGFTEILLIALVAIVALGPEKLPTAMVEVAKFWKKFKSGVTEAKDFMDKEVNVSELKDHAKTYQDSIEHTKNTIIKESGIETANAEMQKINEQFNTNTVNSEKTDDKPKDKKEA